MSTAGWVDACHELRRRAVPTQHLLHPCAGLRKEATQLTRQNRVSYELRREAARSLSRAIALKIYFQSGGYIFMLIDGSSQHHFQQIILIPSSVEAFVFYSDLRGFFGLEQVQGDMPDNRHVGGTVT